VITVSFDSLVVDGEGGLVGEQDGADSVPAWDSVIQSIRTKADQTPGGILYVVFKTIHVTLSDTRDPTCAEVLASPMAFEMYIRSDSTDQFVIGAFSGQPTNDTVDLTCTAAREQHASWLNGSNRFGLRTPLRFGAHLSTQSSAGWPVACSNVSAVAQLQLDAHYTSPL
jgi:hypothetical protein